MAKVKGSALICPHGRAWEECIRCDPWAACNATEEEFSRWQTAYDEWCVRVAKDFWAAIREAAEGNEE